MYNPLNSVNIRTKVEYMYITITTTGCVAGVCSACYNCAVCHSRTKVATR